jgi:hypothetical protein
LIPSDIEFWDKFMPVLGTLDSQQRALAFAHVMAAVRGRDIDDAGMTRLLDELRQKFSGKHHAVGPQ